MSTDEMAPRPEEVVKRALEYLNGHKCMSLATNGQGGIWAATVFYVNSGFELVFMSHGDTRHARNLDSDPRVAVTISNDVTRWDEIRGIQLEGAAEIVEEPQRRDAITSFQRRYTFADSLWWTHTAVGRTPQQRVYRIKPFRVVFVDHGFRATPCEIPENYLPAKRRP
jgi:uncharacterized protein YhbP (UPF0306 family)